MEQQIRFCTTSDGVTIAYATVGEGPTLVYACGWPGHLALEWEKPVARDFLEELARGFTLIRYDMRGSGLSDRWEGDWSVDNLVKDLEAVADDLALERFALLSLGLLAGPVAISYAAAHPQRVTHLLLSSAFLRGDQITTRERQRALIDYIAAFRQLITPDLADAVRLGLDADKVAEARGIHEAGAPAELQVALLRTMFSADVSPLVDRLTMPVLVLHGRSDTRIPFALGREVAALVPHAKFVPHAGSGVAPWAESDVIIPEVRQFLGLEASAQASRVTASSGLVTILFTDMESSTGLTQRLGDAKAQEAVRAHNAIVREALKAHAGSEVKHTGDGIMASFSSPSKALECAVALQRAFEASGQTGKESLRVRIGLNAGEPVAEEEDLFGTAVQLAARVCAQAEPGQILVSNVVRELAAGKGFLFSDVGDVALRGFEDPVRLYEVRWRE